MITRLILLLFLAAGAAPRPVAAQQSRPDSRWSVLRISKWSLAAASAGAAVYGFTMNQRADSRYEALEGACMADPDVCRGRQADGSYTSAELEARYQEVRRLDRKARNGLLASQVGVAATVVLFIIDLRNARAPDDILYEPKPLQVSPRRDGGVELRLRLPVP